MVSYLELAAKARDQGCYGEASRIYLELLDKFGLDPDIMWGLAQTEFALCLVSPDSEDTHGRIAIQWMERALAIRSDRADYYYTLGSMLEHVGAPAYEAAASAYRHAIELEPNYVLALSALAMLYGVPEDVVPLGEALACCERATHANPTRSLWLVLARLYKRAGRQEDSDRALKKGLLERYDTSPQTY